MIEIDPPTPTPGSRSGDRACHSIDRVVVLVRAGLVAVFLPDAGARHEALGHLLVLPSQKRTQASRHGSVSHLPFAPTPVFVAAWPCPPCRPAPLTTNNTSSVHHAPCLLALAAPVPQPCAARAARPSTGQRGGPRAKGWELGTHAAPRHSSSRARHMQCARAHKARGATHTHLGAGGVLGRGDAGVSSLFGRDHRVEHLRAELRIPAQIRELRGRDQAQAVSGR